MKARAQKNLSEVLRALSTIGQVRVAELMGVSESTVSRMKDSEVERFANLLAAVGLKCVREDLILMETSYVQALQVLAKRGIEAAPAPSTFGDVQ